MAPESNPKAEFARLLQAADPAAGLAEAAFQIARIEYPSLEIEPYLQRLDEMGREVAAQLPAGADPYTRIEAINHYLYGEMGFAGNEGDYYDPRNSFLNDVLDRCTGIPITLAIVYMEVGRRVGLSLVGISMPGHFLIRYAEEHRDIYIDAFDRGIVLTRSECAERMRKIFGQDASLTDAHLQPVGPREILARMLSNLRSIYIHREDWALALTVVEWSLLAAPHDLLLYREAGALAFQLGEWERAAEAWGEYLRQVPDAPDADTIRRALASLPSARGRVQ